MIGAAELAGVWERFAANPFYHTALSGGLAIAAVCSILSVFIVLKRMAFIGEGIAHGAFGGVGIALVGGLFLPQLQSVLMRDAIIAAFCVATALSIGFISRRGKLAEDTVIGICLVAAMAVGMLLMDVRGELVAWLQQQGLAQPGMFYKPDIEPIIFGDILFLSSQEAAAAWVLAGVVTLAVSTMFKELVFFTFDEETAVVFGVRTRLLYYGLLVAISLAVVLAMRGLGVILVSALLILPGASARFWSRRIGWVTVISVVIGVGGMATGLFLSIYLRYLSPGPVIVLTYCVIFAASYFARRLLR